MNNTPKTIYRRPGHADTKLVIRAGVPMQTLDVQRLRNASPLQTVKPVRRRALSKRVALLFLLCVLVVIVALAIATSEGRARAQVIGEPWCEIGAPPAPAVQVNCLQPRVYLPEVQR